MGTRTKLRFSPERIPLNRWDDGSIRVADTRVRLETIIRTFDQGQTPEQLAYDFPSLKLDDIYVVCAWVLRHRSDVDAYLRELEAEEKGVRASVESWSPQASIRERLLSRGRVKDAQAPR